MRIKRDGCHGVSHFVKLERALSTYLLKALKARLLLPFAQQNVPPIQRPPTQFNTKELTLYLLESCAICYGVCIDCFWRHGATDAW